MERFPYNGTLYSNASGYGAPPIKQEQWDTLPGPQIPSYGFPAGHPMANPVAAYAFMQYQQPGAGAQWGQHNVLPGGYGGPATVPLHTTPQQPGGQWERGAGTVQSIGANPGAASDERKGSGNENSGADQHQQSWAPPVFQPPNRATSQPNSQSMCRPDSRPPPNLVKVEPKIEPHHNRPVSYWTSQEAACYHRPSSGQSRGHFGGRGLDEKRVHSNEHQHRDHKLRGPSGGSQTETKAQKDEFEAAKVAPGPYEPACQEEGGAQKASSSPADISTPAGGPADVSGRAIVVAPRQMDAPLGGEALSDGGGLSDEDGAESMDGSWGEGDSEDEGQAKSRMEKALQFWRGEVQKETEKAGTRAVFTESRASLHCSVCRKYSNTRQVYQGFRALLQHAKKYEKLQPTQHAAYAAALGEVEMEAEGGGAMVPARKKLRVLDPPEKVWPPIVIVENLRTGVKAGKWEGVSDREMKRAFQDKWPIKNVTEIWKYDGHTGMVLLQYKETCYGYDRARELDECWRAKGQGRDDWEKLRPPWKRRDATVEEEHDTWQRFTRGLVEEDGSRRPFCFLATVADMERIERNQRGKKWRTITAEALEAKRRQEQSQVLEGNLAHAKTRLDNEALKKRNADLQSRVEEKEVELQTITMERAHLNAQHEQWLHDRLASIEAAHREEKLAAQKKADAEKQALEEQLAALNQRRREDHVAMAAIKKDAETRERQLRQVFETGLKDIDQEYNEKEKAAMTRAEEQLRLEREKLQREKEEATRGLLAEQDEKMAEIERERAKAQELMEEARELRDGYLERKKNGNEETDDKEECQICFEPWGEEKRRAVLGCGHARFCKACSQDYFEGDQFKADAKGKRPPFRCPFGCKLGRNNKALELYL